MSPTLSAPRTRPSRLRTLPATVARRVAEVVIGLPFVAAWFLLYRWSPDPP